MKIRNLYLLLPVLFLAELAFGPGGRISSDMALLMVIFAGVFLPVEEAVKFSVIAAFLRGLFTAGLLPASLVIFPVLAVLSAVATIFLNREDIFVQGLLGAFFTGVLIFFEGAYFKVFRGASVDLLSLLSGSWPFMLLAAVAAPLIFYLFKKVVIVR